MSVSNFTHFGYWIFGKDMNNVNLAKLKTHGVTDIFLNYYAFTAHGTQKVTSWITQASNQYNMNVHIWVQCFYDGEWHNPKTTNLNPKLREIQKYATTNGVKGIHLDYLRYPGNAHKTEGGADAITNFVKKVRSQNPNVLLSCALMPEDNIKYYYGQDVDALKSTLDFVIPMQYKGNYHGDTKWLASTTKLFSQKIPTWSGLQTYKSDDNPTQLSNTELLDDAKTCINNGAKGIVLFRYGMSPDIDFTSLQPKTTNNSDKMKISAADIKTMAVTVKNYVEKNKKLPTTVTVGKTKYTYGQVAYILAFEINNLGKAADVFAVKNAPNAGGNSINENILKDDYKDIAKRVANYIKKNKVCPNYATTKKSKKNLRARVFIYMFARIIAFYYNNKKTLPNYANANSGYFKSSSTSTATKKSTSNGLHDYLTSSGCSGMGQCTGYYCACNSLQQAFYRLTGIKVAESTIAKWAGTTTDGTDHAGINTAVAQFNKTYKKNVKIVWYNFSELNWSKIIDMMKKGAVFFHLLYRNQWGHYEGIQSVGDDILKILNSLGDYCSYPAYCGYIENRSKSTQKQYIQGISQKSVAYLYNG